jgi:hypothetical protein
MILVTVSVGFYLVLVNFMAFVYVAAWINMLFDLIFL